MRLTLDQARKATQGSVLHAQRFPPSFSIVTDTRTLKKNDVYLALRGERFDGHDFVGQAYRQGAAAAIVDRVPEQCEEIPSICVGDTKAAYMELARAARQQFAGRVVALTGSTGKTTTKTFLRCMLAQHYGDRLAATPGNENNEIGVSKLLLSVNPDAEVVIVEMGARHYHDIAALVEIARPDVAILTNVGEAHLQIMGSLERLAQTKWEIFQTGAQPILNWNDSVSRAKCASLVRQPRWFAAGEALVEENLPEHLTVVTASSLSVRLGNAREEVSTEVTIPGAHNLSNVAAAAAGALAVNVPARTIAAAISTLKLPSGRYETIQIKGRARIIYDAYNASMSGMIATLDAFAKESGRRIAVLSSMAELGPQAARMHQIVGAHLCKNVDVVLVGGEFADEFARGARETGFPASKIIPFQTNAQAISWLRTNTTHSDVVLLKGSRIYKLEEIVEGLRADA